MAVFYPFSEKFVLIIKDLQNLFKLYNIVILQEALYSTIEFFKWKITAWKVFYTDGPVARARLKPTTFFSYGACLTFVANLY